jgi:hypothetical protein
MNPEDKIKELISKSNVTVDSRTDKRILGDSLEDLKKLKQKQSAEIRPNL